MDKSFFFSDEKLISESDNKLVTLTSYRIRLTEGRRIVSIMLKEVSSIELHYKTKLWYLILALISILAGLVYGAFEGDELAFVVGAGLSAVFVIMYITTRMHTVSVRSSSNTINFHVKRMKHSSIIGFINDVEGAIAKL